MLGRVELKETTQAIRAGRKRESNSAGVLKANLSDNASRCVYLVSLNRAVCLKLGCGPCIYGTIAIDSTHDREGPPPDVATRILDGVGALAGEHGFAGLSVESVLQKVGVSRASFYQHFTSIEDCVWQAYRECADGLIRQARAGATSARHPELALLDVLVTVARETPAVAQLLMREGLAAGERLLAERERLISGLDAAIARDEESQSLDIPFEILIGGIFRFLSLRLDAGDTVNGVEMNVREWAESFMGPPSEMRWAARFDPALPDREECAAWRSRRRQEGTPRERIIRATGETLRREGYRAATVADIAGAAAVSRRGFYCVFRTKEEAFIATYENAFHRTLQACTPAFFVSGTWPERVWEGAVAFTRFLSEEPLVAYVGLVECYALKRDFALRVHDTQLAFTLFLEDGYRQRPEAQLLSRTCSALTACAIFEAAFQVTLRSPGLYLRRAQPLAVYMALTPFIGRTAAGEFVLEKLKTHRGPAGRAGLGRPVQRCAPSSSA